MGVAYIGLVHRDPCKCKVKGFRAVSSIERNVSKRRHLQGVRQELSYVWVRPPSYARLTKCCKRCAHCGERDSPPQERLAESTKT